MAIITIKNRAITLDAAEIPNLDASKITSGSFADARIPNLATSKITSGTFADARIAASNVSQHATSFDDNKIVNDLSTLGLRVHTQENLNASNTNSASFDVFQDSSGITNLTNTQRDSGEYISSVSTNTGTASSNVGGSDTNFGDGNTRWSSSGSLRDQYQTGNDLGYSGTSYNYNFLSSSDGQDADHAVASDDALVVGNGKFWFDGVSNDVGSGTGDNANPEYYEVGFLDNFLGVTNTSFLNHDASSNISGICMAFSGQSRDIKIIKVTGGNTRTYLTTIAGSELSSSSSVIQMARMDGRIYISFDNVLKYTVSASDFNSTANLAVLMAFGRGSSGARHFNNIGYRANMTRINGLPYSEQVASATGSFEGNAITASSTNKMGAVITYQDNAGTNTLNTDIILKLSADNGSNYSTATLTALPDFATGIKMAKVNDLSVTAGTQLKYKIEFANQAAGTKEARLRGVSLQY